MRPGADGVAVGVEGADCVVAGGAGGDLGVRVGGAGEGVADEQPAGLLVAPDPEFILRGAGQFGPAQFDCGRGRVGGEGGDGQGGLGGLLVEVAGDWSGRGGGNGAREEKGDGDGDGDGQGGRG